MKRDGRFKDTFACLIDSMIGIRKVFKFPEFVWDIGDYASLPLIELTALPLVWLYYDFETALITGGICIGVATLMGLPIFLESPLSKRYDFRKGKWRFCIYPKPKELSSGDTFQSEK